MEEFWEEGLNGDLVSFDGRFRIVKEDDGIALFDEDLRFDRYPVDAIEKAKEDAAMLFNTEDE